MKLPSELLAAVTVSIQAILANDFGVAAYDGQFQPPAKNVSEVLNLMTAPAGLVVYEGFGIGEYGWVHRFAFYLAAANQVTAMDAMKKLLDSAAASDSNPWYTSEVHSACDPPSNVDLSTEQADDGNEQWVLRFALQEKGLMDQ